MTLSFARQTDDFGDGFSDCGEPRRNCPRVNGSLFQVHATPAIRKSF
jgi:hypothetical protein